jgi:hypothetical protein
MLERHSWIPAICAGQVELVSGGWLGRLCDEGKIEDDQGGVERLAPGACSKFT